MKEPTNLEFLLDFLHIEGIPFKKDGGFPNKTIVTVLNKHEKVEFFFDYDKKGNFIAQRKAK